MIIKLLTHTWTSTQVPHASQPADGKMLRPGSDGAEEEIESVLEQYGERRDGRFGGESFEQGFNVRPGQVDVEKEEQSAETEDRRV